MHIYSLHCFDKSGATVFRRDFEAEHNSEARLIAGAICDACSDEHHRFELWKDDLPVADGKTLGALLDDGGLSPRARQAVRHTLIALLGSDWRVSHSRRLRGKVGAWSAETGDAMPPPRTVGVGPHMRRFHRGVEYAVQSPDGVRWSWTAHLGDEEAKTLAGSLHGDKSDAVRLCMEAIDEALREASVPATSRTARNTSSPAATPVIGAPAMGTPISGRTVLIADDEAMFRDAVALSLQASGFKVFQAADGQEALAILKDNCEIALLVSDIRMPGLDGYALTEAGLELRPDLKVILMTGYAADPPKLVLDRQIGTFRKPIDTNLLCHRAAELIAAH
ncbi:MAG TPA: response regulator [Rhizomicrobium sp.]|jgi:CheY-like chemotaxis protein|nr:response regulator [Rhizomicrobium sp.]